MRIKIEIILDRSQTCVCCWPLENLKPPLPFETACGTDRAPSLCFQRCSDSHGLFPASLLLPGLVSHLHLTKLRLGEQDGEVLFLGLTMSLRLSNGGLALHDFR